MFVVQVEFDQALRTASVVKREEQLELPGYWGDMTYYWDANDDMLGFDNLEVETRLSQVIHFLENEGVDVGVPDASNSSWGWGCRTNPDWDKKTDPNGYHRSILLPVDERKRIFLYHLHYFLQVAKSYPHTFFVDESFLFFSTKIYRQESRQNKAEVYTLNQAYTLNDVENKESEAVVYYRHPGHGTIRVDTFAKAMEIYGFAKASQDPRTESWWRLSLTLPGAPTVKK